MWGGCSMPLALLAPYKRKTALPAAAPLIRNGRGIWAGGSRVRRIALCSIRLPGPCRTGIGPPRRTYLHDDSYLNKLRFMQHKSFRNMPCPIARSLERVGEWWSMLIMRDALHGLTRFDEFQKSLGIAPNMLRGGSLRWSRPGCLSAAAIASGRRATNTGRRHVGATSGRSSSRCLPSATHISPPRAQA